MPYRNTPWVRNGQVVTSTGQLIKLDTPAWFAWLETVPSFCFSSPHTTWRLTVRREKRRHQTYWYGYAKMAAKLHNVYLGKTERLSQARLEQACRDLAHKVRPEEEVFMTSP
jgi:hypothetical protein